MSKDKQTFTDPKTGEQRPSKWWARVCLRLTQQTFLDPQTGEEIPSTWVARLCAGMACSLFAFPMSLLFFCSVVGLHFCLKIGVDRWSFCLLVWLGLIGVLSAGLGVGFIMGLISVFSKSKELREISVIRWTHDRIARTQHRRRQRVLRSQDDQDVPDGAISRAQPPGEPQATDAALSMADTTDKTEHLTSDVETEDGGAVIETENTA